MKTTHYFDTANADNLNLAERAALKAGLSFYKELRPTCIKKYHFEVTATTPAQESGHFLKARRASPAPLFLLRPICLYA